MIIQGKDSGEVFEKVYFNIIENGIQIKDTKCLFNQILIIDKPSIENKFPSWRKFNSKYASDEFDWYLSGDRSIKDISKKASLWKRMADKNGEVWSNYGYHWKQNKQLDKIVEMLRMNPSSRRAIISHYDYNQLDNYTKDTPCNLILHFQYTSDNTIDLTIFARSIDLVYGFCNDQYCFSRLMEIVCVELMADIGKIYYHISNLHIYKKHWNIHERQSNI